MKRFSLIAMLIMSLPAAAENWVRYAQTADASLYYDKERMILMSGTAFIWDLHDLRADAAGAGDNAHRSVLHAVEVNCRKEQHRVLSYHRMSGAMGGGKMVGEHSLVSEWKTPAANSAESRLMTIACEQ